MSTYLLGHSPFNRNHERTRVMDVIGYSFLYAGTGRKDSGFPKDVQALARTAHEHGQTLRKKNFCPVGGAFRPNTNDMRDAPSRVIVQALLQNLQFADKAMEAVQGADPLIIVTEWKAYRSPNWTVLKVAMKEPVIFDGRNLYEPQTMQESGVHYVAIGRAHLGRSAQLA